MNQEYKRGSCWRKWDLQVHTPNTKLNNAYGAFSDDGVLDKFCEKIEQSDVEVFGITDYFSADGFKIFKYKFKQKYPRSAKKFFLNIELRLNESVNKELQEVNVHLIFNPDSLSKIDKFLNKLKIVKTGKGQTSITCSELRNGDYESATVTREDIEDAIKETFGNVRQDSVLIFTCANNDGIRSPNGSQRKAVITDEIDKFSDAFFGSNKNIEYFLDVNRLEDNQTIGKKPVVACSDSHSFEDLDNFLGKRVTEGEGDGEVVIKDVTWIKADPTFEGLKQIIYEPELGERISLGPVKPDFKDDYKIIRKIKFQNANDFQDEIEFNDNLCSVIGSRSSGKSALLAYIAHSIDPKNTEFRKTEPGAGISWEEIEFQYKIEWANGSSSEESNGQVVYIPQGFLFDVSKNSEEVKERIEPVLFKKLPDFEESYLVSKEEIKICNDNISREVDRWFLYSENNDRLEAVLRELGDKSAIEKERGKIELKIESIKKRYKLTEDDLKKLQEISAEILKLKNRIKQIDADYLKIPLSGKDDRYLKRLEFLFTPTLESLPAKLNQDILKQIENDSNVILGKVNTKIGDYKSKMREEKAQAEKMINEIMNSNLALIEKHKHNAELQDFVKKLSAYSQILDKIKELEANIQAVSASIKETQRLVKAEIDDRKSIIDRIKAKLESLDQNSFDIIFSIEHDFNEDEVRELTQKINLKYSSNFIGKDNHQLDVARIRDNVPDFLSQIYSGKQKINIGNSKKNVAKEALTLTEKILFAAKMEGDCIGGFKKSTMTPGKQALFALKLILDESEETWPLLIDQPEDDLDSRSIYSHIVPFLKKKKKERQIIMVSHNANLVIGSDSEQIIVANRNADDRRNIDGKQFNYISGSIENTKEKDETEQDTLKSQGIREHACEILDGGRVAFEQRRNKYNLAKEA